MRIWPKQHLLSTLVLFLKFDRVGYLVYVQVAVTNTRKVCVDQEKLPWKFLGNFNVQSPII